MVERHDNSQGADLDEATDVDDWGGPDLAPVYSIIVGKGGTEARDHVCV